MSVSIHAKSVIYIAKQLDLNIDEKLALTEPGYVSVSPYSVTIGGEEITLTANTVCHETYDRYSNNAVAVALFKRAINDPQVAKEELVFLIKQTLNMYLGKCIKIKDAKVRYRDGNIEVKASNKKGVMVINLEDGRFYKEAKPIYYHAGKPYYSYGNKLVDIDPTATRVLKSEERQTMVACLIGMGIYK